MPRQSIPSCVPRGGERGPQSTKSQKRKVLGPEISEGLTDGEGIDQ